jgi:hypothetical protein
MRDPVLLKKPAQLQQVRPDLLREAALSASDLKILKELNLPGPSEG